MSIASRAALATFLIALVLYCGRAQAWSFQGHILITRLACLQIIDDPAAPAGLRDFLKQVMPYSLADCRSLALIPTLGGNPPPSYSQGLDLWATMPDRMAISNHENIAPYGMPERNMHFCQLEAFGKVFAYKDDLSSKPNVNQIPHDLSDPRWKLAGYVPWRVEEMYQKLAQAIGPGMALAHPEDALHAAGYLAHYVEDSTQPHHATLDYHSVTYLAGHIKEIPALSQPDAAALAAIRLPATVNPHSAIEYYLFDNDQPPRDAFRREYWKDLIDDIATLAAQRAAGARPSAGSFDPFRWDLATLSQSYDYLPFVGRASRAGYATETFDPQAFFGYQGDAHGEKMTMIQLIALQNAKAALNVAQVYRLAWEEAHRGVDQN
jgi:hypothetical protein